MKNHKEHMVINTGDKPYVPRRTTVYNNISAEYKVKRINRKNKILMADFCTYLQSVDRSPKTIFQYKSDMRVFFCWVYTHAENKPFKDLTKKDIMNFQNHALEVWKWSPKRILRVKAVLSSLSKYIENMLDDDPEYAGFKNIIYKIENPADQTVREKTILTTDDVQRLLDYLVEKKEYEKALAIAILSYSGMRKAELLQMKMEYFDKDHFKYGCLYETDKIRCKGRGKQGKMVRKYILNQIDPYLKLWDEYRKSNFIDSEWVFIRFSNKEHQWEPRQSIDSWKDEFSAFLHKPFYFHCLRHKLCSELVSKNVPAEVIREFFEWESINMISIYNDNSAKDEFGKYFNSDGIIDQKTSRIDEI